MKYIIYESAITSLSESVQSNGEVVEFVTTLQEADVKNRNGRIYPKQVIEEGLKGPMVQEKLRRHSLFGEVGHPYSQDVARQTQVDINNCAFRINEMWWEGNLLKGKCETLDTAKGRDMAGLIKQGCELSFSMRGQGNVARDPYRDALVVKSPLMIITYDWVYLPSHQTAYMDSFTEETRESMTNAKAYSNMSMALNESANLYENGSLVEINEETKEKPMKDYYSNYRRSIKTLNETYIYDANDKVKEINDKYVILENADCLKKVAKEDYLLKNIRSSMKEGCEGIAPLDVMYSTEPLTDEKAKCKKCDTGKLETTQEIGKDVKPVIVEDNVLEASTEPATPVDKELDEKGLKSDGVAIATTEIKSDDITPNDTSIQIIKVETDPTTEITVDPIEKELEIDLDSVDPVKNDISLSIVDESNTNMQPTEELTDNLNNPTEELTNEDKKKLKKKKDKTALKEEFNNIYNLISSETGLTNDKDILSRGLNYSEYMSEECIELFKYLLNKGE